MKSIKKWMFLALGLIGVSALAQKNYYSINGNLPVSEAEYQKTKQDINKIFNAEEFHLFTKTTQDSVINYIIIERATKTDMGIDPWEAAKESIGKRFKIELYKNEDSQKFDKDELLGKPTFINFWFTQCPPCIEELPILNTLEKIYKGRVNFISITFNNKKMVESFLKEHPFNFRHIFNAYSQIHHLGISAFPTSFILDKDGVVRVVRPALSVQDLNNAESTLDMLLKQ